jgi:hypothetical protein
LSAFDVLPIGWLRREKVSGKIDAERRNSSQRRRLKTVSRPGAMLSLKKCLRRSSGAPF